MEELELLNTFSWRRGKYFSACVLSSNVSVETMEGQTETAFAQGILGKDIGCFVLPFTFADRSFAPLDNSDATWLVFTRCAAGEFSSS